jgi:hypothetical protein
MPMFDSPSPFVGCVPAAAAPRNWIAVASADPARRGRDEMTPGFMQVCHGKCAPLKRMRPGDRVAYYAPTVRMGGPERCQCFVSIGVVLPGDPYAFDMGGGFVPHRRDVAYVSANEMPIQPLLDHFEFVEDRSRWGYKFRFGLFAVSDHDMALIARAMGASLEALGWSDVPKSDVRPCMAA